MRIRNIAFIFAFWASVAAAQTDTTTEEDYSAYDEMVPEGGASLWASPKVFDLSPQKLITIGYDVQGPYDIKMKWVTPGSDTNQGSSGTYGTKYSHGLRVGFNIPVISKQRLTWTVAGNYLESKYKPKNEITLPVVRPVNALENSLNRGLRNLSLATTVFVPFGPEKFLLFQGQADVSGDYKFGEIGDYLNKTKVSGALVYGIKPHDRLQWGLGLSRSYRVGEVNILPVLLYNYTWPNRKYGAEVLFPARAAIRRTFNSRTIALFGYELEGQSYALNQSQEALNFNYFGIKNPELRRGEIRLRGTWEKSISGFIWISLQVGYRINYAFNVDDGEFFRGFFGTQPFVMENKLTNTPYALFSINLVSP